MSKFDPLDVRAQEASREEATERARFAQQQEADDFKWLMGSKRGRRMVWRLLDRAAVFRLSFNTNAMQMAFAEGGKNEGLRTLALIHSICPDLYPVMVQENTKHDD